MTKVVLLGPQRHVPTVRSALDDLGVDGPVAVVTAGWEEREREVGELSEHLGCETRNLKLFSRSEKALDKDPELLDALRALNDRMRTLQEHYRLRLAHTMGAVRELVARRGAQEGALLEEEIEHALGAVHVLDQHHTRRTADALGTFDERYKPTERESIGRARGKVKRDLSPCAALLVAGGHVAVLATRLRLFVIDQLIEERPVVAWSAGAMAVTDQIVLFHDSPPQGRGFAEVLTDGMGLCPHLVALPHARHRLLLDDPSRVSVMARRFQPASCLALDERSRATWDGKRWTLGAGTRWLGPDGTLHEEAVPA